MGKDKPETKFLKKSWILWWIIIALFFIAASIFIYIFLPNEKFTSERLGQIGDYFGGILNPTLAFFSFIALLVTIFLQGEELKATREELSRSAEAQEKSEKIFKKQQFESTFFSILNQLNIFANKFMEDSMNKENDPIKNGRNNIIIDWKYVIDSVFKYEENYHISSFPNKYKLHTSEYEKIEINYLIKRAGVYEIQIRRISNLIYELLQFINRENLTPETARVYTNIIRSCISNELLQILAVYWCREDLEHIKKCKDLIEQYAFLEHMTFHLLHESSPSPLLRVVREKYADSAFGDSDYLKKLLAFERDIEKNK